MMDAMPHYSQNFEVYRQFLSKIVQYDLRMFEIPTDVRVLDIGCGFGDDVRRLQNMGYARVSGVEPDAYCVEQCAGLDVRVGSIEDTGCDDGSFDVVLVNNVFHHCQDYGAALSEIARILKPSGFLCFVEPRASLPRRVLDFLTFQTALPGLVGGPLLQRYRVMSEEVATGLYPQWLRSQERFFSLFEQYFKVVWLRRSTFFFSCKAERNC